MIPRAVEATWQRIRELNDNSNNMNKIDVHVTFYEVYRGKVRDLLVRMLHYRPFMHLLRSFIILHVIDMIYGYDYGRSQHHHRVIKW